MNDCIGPLRPRIHFTNRVEPMPIETPTRKASRALYRERASLHSRIVQRATTTMRDEGVHRHESLGGIADAEDCPWRRRRARR